MHAHEAQDLQIYAPLCTKVVLRWKWPATPMYKFLFCNMFSHRFISPDFPNQIDPSVDKVPMSLTPPCSLYEVVEPTPPAPPVHKGCAEMEVTRDADEKVSVLQYVQSPIHQSGLS